MASFDAMLSSSRKNPDRKLPESMFVRLFPVPLASMVLFVNVCVLSSVVTLLPPTVAVVASKLATSVPVVTEIPPDLSPAVAVVVPTVNLSADSSQPMNALLPVEPLSMIKPASLLDADIPEFNSMMLSAIVVLVVEIVVVVPFTVRSPLIVALPDVFNVVNVPAAAALAPMVVPSIAPPLMSAVLVCISIPECILRSLD